MKFKNLFKKLTLILFACLINNINAKEKLAIEISSCKTKVSTFAISSNNQELSKKITKFLEITKRFKNIKNQTSIEQMQQAGIDISIKLLLIENKIEVEIYDVLQKKIIKAFCITFNNNIEAKNESFNQALIEIANQIYQTWLNETGIFNTKLFFSTKIGNDLYTLEKIEYTNNASQKISPPIAYLGNIGYLKNHIIFTKFCTKKRGFSIFSFHIPSKKFQRILSIKSSTTFSPFINENDIYISAANNNTTGIYTLPEPLKPKNFKNFKSFEENIETKTLIKMPNKIATSLNIYNNLVIFCSNKHQKAAIFKANLINSKLENIQQISKAEGAYYDPILFKDKKIAAIQIHDKMFHLVLIDLENNQEKRLITRYYIDKPCFSPCGNWIAISARNKGEKDEIILIHKSGKYQRTISSPLALKTPIWIQNDE